MEISMTAQTALFLHALLLGAVLGVGYDVCRVTRVALRLSWAVILVEDVLFFLLAALLLFRYFLERSGGEVRIFAVLGVLLGWLLYYLTLGGLVIRAAAQSIAFLASVVLAILAPLGKMLRILQKIGLRGLKLLILLKNSLKSRLGLLYNTCISHQRRGVRRSWHGKKQKKGVPPSTRSSA